MPSNPLKRYFLLTMLKLNNINVYSFDINDCNKYGFNFHNQIINTEVYKDLNFDNKDFEYDLFFIGYDKNRSSELTKINNLVPKSNNFIRIIKDHTSIKITDLHVEKGYSYSEYLKLLDRSKCVVELCQPNQSGLTTRSLEALYLGKKLITNNVNIKKSELFNENQVFIYDKFNIDFCNFLYYEAPPKNPRKYFTKYTIQNLLNVIDGI